MQEVEVATDTYKLGGSFLCTSFISALFGYWLSNVPSDAFLLATRESVSLSQLVQFPSLEIVC